MLHSGLKTQNKAYVISFVLIILFVITQNSFATIDSTFQNGNWNTASTWRSGVPVAGDTVVILNTHSVTLDVNVNIDSIVIQAGGTLIFDDGGVGTARTFTSRQFTNNGVLNVNLGLGFAQHSLNVSGDFRNTGTFSAVNGSVVNLNLIGTTGTQLFSITSGSVSFNAVTFAGAAAKTGIGNTTINVNGAFSIASGSGTYTSSNRAFNQSGYSVL